MVVNRIGRFSVQTPLGAWAGLGTLPHYKAPGDLWVEIVQSKKKTTTTNKGKCLT